MGQKHWKYIIVGAGAAIILVSVFFTLPLWNVPLKNVETYTAIEYYKEPYRVEKPVIVEEISQKTGVIIDDLYQVAPVGTVGVVYWGSNFSSGETYSGMVKVPFSIERADARLSGRFTSPVESRFEIIDGSGHSIWQSNGIEVTIDLPVPQGQYRVKIEEEMAWEDRHTYDKDCYIHLAVMWDEIEQVTKLEESTGYRDVPVEVVKQRTITTYQKASIWQILFGHHRSITPDT